MRISPINTKISRYSNKPAFMASSPKAKVYIGYKPRKDSSEQGVSDVVLNGQPKSDNVYDKNIVEEIGSDGQTYIFLEEKEPQPRIDVRKAEDSLGIYFKQINKYPLLSVEEEREITKKMCEAHDEKAKQLLINSNLRFVVSMAKKYTGMGMPLLDLIQEGNLGLMRAAETFDYKLGNKFCSYAVWYIEQYIINSIKNKGRTIRLPISQIEQINKIKGAVVKLTKELGRPPLKDEIAAELDMSDKKLAFTLKSMKNTISLDSPIRPDDNDSKKLIEFIPYNPNISANEMGDLDIMRWDYVKTLFERLSSIEQDVLKLKFGFDGGAGMSRPQIASAFGVPKCAIRRIERHALDYLKQNCKDFERIMLSTMGKKVV